MTAGRVLVCGFFMMLSAAAMAMPQVEGKYKCISSKANEEFVVTFVQKDGRLLFADEKGELDSADEGLACANDSHELDLDGASMKVATFCDNTSIGIEINMVQPEKNTNFKTRIEIRSLSATQANWSIEASGILEGQAMSEAVVLSCQRQ